MHNVAASSYLYFFFHIVKYFPPVPRLHLPLQDHNRLKLSNDEGFAAFPRQSTCSVDFMWKILSAFFRPVKKSKANKKKQKRVPWRRVALSNTQTLNSVSLWSNSSVDVDVSVLWCMMSHYARLTQFSESVFAQLLLQCLRGLTRQLLGWRTKQKFTKGDEVESIKSIRRFRLKALSRTYTMVYIHTNIRYITNIFKKVPFRSKASWVFAGCIIFDSHIFTDYYCDKYNKLVKYALL